MICNRCKVDKLEEEFIYGKKKCKICYDKCRKYYKENREKEIARAQKSNSKKDRCKENERKRAACRKNPVPYILWNVKSRAKARGIPFELSHEDIKIPNVCPILGIELRISEGCPDAQSPSVDRINPNLGYVRGNIEIISHRANTIKSNATLQELKSLVRYLETKVEFNSGPTEKTYDGISRSIHPLLDNLVLKHESLG